MGSNTPNYNLYKPAIDEEDWGAAVNTSTDTVDTTLAANKVLIDAQVADIATNAADIATNVTAIGLNTTHRGSSGNDHTWIDQDVTSGAAPVFDAGNMTNVPGATQTMQATFDYGQTITIADTDNQTLTLTQNDTTNNPDAMTITNAGTGNGLLIDQNGNGVSLNIDSEATTATVVNIASVNTSGVVLDVRNAGAGGQAAYFANTNGSGAGTSVGIDNSGTGHGLVINQVPATDAGRQALRVFMTTDRTIADTALVKFEDQGSSTTEPTLEVRTGGGSGIELFNAGTGNGLLIDQNGNGVALKIDNAGTSADIEMNATGGGIIFPTSDPNIAGAWWDDTGTLTKSSG